MNGNKMMRITLTFLVFAAFFAGGCQHPRHKTSQQEAEQDWNQVRAKIKLQLANEQYKNGDLADANKLAGQVIALNPSDATGYAVMAKISLARDDLIGAARALAMARQNGVRDAQLIYLEGVVLEQQGKTEQALACYHEAHDLDSTQIDFVIAETECLVTLGRVKDARSFIEERLSIFEHDASLATLGAHLAALVGDTADALRWYTHAAMLAPDDRNVAENYGLLLAKEQRYREAIAALAPLVPNLGDDAQSGQIRRALAKSYLQTGDPQSARNVLDTYLNVNRSDARGQLLLAKACIALGDILTARRNAALARDNNPNLAEAWFVRAVIEWQDRQPARAVAMLDHVLETSPCDIEAHCLMAEVLLETGKENEARMHFERALAIDAECLWAAKGIRRLGRANATRTNRGMNRWDGEKLDDEQQGSVFVSLSREG